MFMVFTVTYSQKKAIIIGDSQCNYISLNTKKAKLYLPLFKIGVGLQGLNELVKKNSIKTDVDYVFVSIGVNDNYNYREIGFIKNLKRVFPNAKIYMIKGSYGWGNTKHFKESYYKKFNQEIFWINSFSI